MEWVTAASFTGFWGCTQHGTHTDLGSSECSEDRWGQLACTMLWALEEKPGKGWDRQGQFCISGDDPTALQTGACGWGGAGRGRVGQGGGQAPAHEGARRLVMLQLIGHVCHGHGEGLGGTARRPHCSVLDQCPCKVLWDRKALSPDPSLGPATGRGSPARSSSQEYTRGLRLPHGAQIRTFTQ